LVIISWQEKEAAQIAPKKNEKELNKKVAKIIQQQVAVYIPFYKKILNTVYEKITPYFINYNRSLPIITSCKKSSTGTPAIKIEYTGDTTFSEARYSLSAAAAGNKIVFAGGAGATGFSQTVDIYDVSTNTWTTAQLSKARSNCSAAGAGNKILVGGRLATTFSKTVDIFTLSK
jgi:hypothetical protein